MNSTKNEQATNKFLCRSDLAIGKFLPIASNLNGLIKKVRGFDALRQVFERMRLRLALMREGVKAISAEGLTDVRRGIENYMASDPQVAIAIASSTFSSHGFVMPCANCKHVLGRATPARFTPARPRPCRSG